MSEIENTAEAESEEESSLGSARNCQEGVTGCKILEGETSFFILFHFLRKGAGGGGRERESQAGSRLSPEPDTGLGLMTTRS